MSELKPCPFCGSPAYSYHDNCIDFAGVKCNLGGCVCADILITENNWNTRPIEDNLIARIAELEAGAISAGKQEVETKNRLLKERDKKIANLHKVIAKQQLKIQRQAENITTLLHLYTSGKRSKSHKKLREKYRALKARMR